jgi:hypothetical protein
MAIEPSAAWLTNSATGARRRRLQSLLGVTLSRFERIDLEPLLNLCPRGVQNEWPEANPFTHNSTGQCGPCQRRRLARQRVASSDATPRVGTRPGSAPNNRSRGGGDPSMIRGRGRFCRASMARSLRVAIRVRNGLRRRHSETTTGTTGSGLAHRRAGPADSFEIS